VQPIKIKNSSLKNKALLWHLFKKNNEIAKKNLNIFKGRE
jgi:hypothetical protein